MTSKKIAFLTAIICFVASVQVLPAEEIESSRELVLQASSMPEVKLGFTQNLIFPVLQGESFLTENNNLKLSLTAEITPISLNGLVTAVLTPIAFLEFIAGCRIGSGWNVELFGGEITGIGKNKADENGMAQHDGSAFDGMLWQVKCGGAFQFDLAAIFPGDWNHIVMRTYHEINYGGYSRAKKKESWYFESDDGENINGLNYYANYLLGYQMPIILNMAALLAEAELNLYDIPGRSQWGDDKAHWTFGCIFNFAVLEQLDVTLITQMRTVRNYNESNWEELYYRNRSLDGSKPVSLEFYRVAAVVTYRF